MTTAEIEKVKCPACQGAGEIPARTTPTERQRQVLGFVRAFHEEHNALPTLQQVAAAIGVKSLSTVSEHITALRKKGLLAKLEAEA